ncbi:hypothetical protein VPH35_126011 [Triticum aestivum]
MDRDETTATSLPEDVVGEILLRVKDMADLFHCARTCKRWSRLVADIRRHRPDQMSTSLLSGFFAKRGKVRYLFPTPGSLFGPDRRLLGSFLRGTTRDLSRATPLVARHGLLLVHLPSSDAPSTIHLALCNLLAGTCDELPPLKMRWKFDNNGYAIITDADRSSNGKTSHVLVMYYNDRQYYSPCVLHTFLYNEGRWIEPTNLGREAKNFSNCGPLKHSDAVVCQGTARWLVGYHSSHHNYLHTINVDVENSNVSMTKIVTPTEDILSRTYYEPQLSVATDETLSLLCLQRPGLQVKIYMQQGNRGSENGGTWLYTRNVELKPPKQIRAEEMHLTLLGEKSGTLFVKDNCMNVYAVDLKTGVMKSLTYHGKVTHGKVVPFETYWPMF